MVRILAGLTAILLLGSIPKEEPEALARLPLEGSWTFVSVDFGAGADTKGDYVMQITGDQLVLRSREGKVTYACAFDHTASPPRISWGKMRGIYSVIDGTLTMAMNNRDDPWPTGFKPRGGTCVYVFKRPKPRR